MSFYIKSHFRIQDIWHNLRCNINYCHGKSLRLQIFRNLKSDKSCADNNCFFYVFCLYVRAHGNRVIRRTHFENSLFICSGNWRNNRRSSCCNYKLVVGVSFCFICFQIFRLKGFGSGIKTDSFSVCVDGYAGKTCKFCRSIYHKLFAGFNKISNIVGKTAACIGNFLILCKKSNFCITVFSF